MSLKKIYAISLILIMILPFYVSSWSSYSNMVTYNQKSDTTSIDLNDCPSCQNLTEIINEYANYSYPLTQDELDSLRQSHQNLSNTINKINEMGFTNCLGKWKMVLVIGGQNISFFVGFRSDSDETNCTVIGLVYFVPEWNTEYCGFLEINDKVLLLLLDNESMAFFENIAGFRFNYSALVNGNVPQLEVWGQEHNCDPWWCGLCCFLWEFYTPSLLGALCYGLMVVCALSHNIYVCIAFGVCLLVIAIACIFKCSSDPCYCGYDEPDGIITLSKSLAEVNEAIIFDGSSSSDPNDVWIGDIFIKDIILYRWDYGDGFYNYGMITTHSYSTPGLYTATLTVTDKTGYTDTQAVQIQILDIVTTPPTIEIVYQGDSTDGNPGYWTVSASDPSGISSMSVIIDGSLAGTCNGNYIVPNSLGIHVIEVTATNTDTSPLTSTVIQSVNIIDDDSTPPSIQINYESGDGTDGNPGQFTWQITDTDDVIGGDGDIGLSNIEIEVNYKSIDNSNDFEIILPSIETGIWILPPYLGNYTIAIIASDNDNDRTLALDQLTISCSLSKTIVDDDIKSPSVSDLTIEGDFLNVDISFIATDEFTGDDQGISAIYIFIDDELVMTYNPLPSEIFFNFQLSNDWILEFGLHQLRIEVIDADNDRASDAIMTSAEESFEVTLDEMKQFVNWEIDQLNKDIQQSPEECWSGPVSNRKFALNNKVNELKDLISLNAFRDAYDKLLHDIKPKLTGLKTDENEEPWGNGVFNNPWVIYADLQEIFRIDCNVILTHITILNGL